VIIDSDRPEYITEIGPWSREGYFARLWRSSVIPILWPMWEMHSLGYCHAIKTKNVVVTPGGPAKFPVAGIQLDGKLTPESLADGLSRGLDRAHDPEFLLEQLDWLYRNRSIQGNVAIMRETLESLA
jgi:hypothetical protein